VAVQKSIGSGSSEEVDERVSQRMRPFPFGGRVGAGIHHQPRRFVQINSRTDITSMTASRTASSGTWVLAWR